MAGFQVSLGQCQCTEMQFLSITLKSAASSLSRLSSCHIRNKVVINDQTPETPFMETLTEQRRKTGGKPGLTEQIYNNHCGARYL